MSDESPTTPQGAVAALRVETTFGDRQCIYCGATGKLTSEHVFGDWTRKYVDRPLNKHDFQTVISPSPGKEVGKPVQIRAGDPLNSQVKVVCEPCNSGWMSVIQNRAKPFLLPLFKGEAIALGRDAQRQIANWAALAAITGEFISRDPKDVSVTREERKKMMERSRPPHSFRIWIGNYERQKWQGQWRHTTLTIHPEDKIAEIAAQGSRVANHQTTTFIIGKLYVHVFSGYFRKIVTNWNWSTAPNARSTLKQIWPCEDSVVRWPALKMTDADAFQFSRAFEKKAERAAAKGGWWDLSGNHVGSAGI